MERYVVTPTGPALGEIRPPGSKSITNRALVCAALADGESVLSGALASEDTLVMIESLRAIGIDVQTEKENSVLHVTGCGGHPPQPKGDLFVANSGTTIRFLTAMLAATGGEYRLDGVPRMHERPIEDLLKPLRQLGADAVSERGNGCPPVLVRSAGLRGGEVPIRGDISSQYLSGLLMAAPLARHDLKLVIDGLLVSQPYVHMTLRVMEAFGVETQARLPPTEGHNAARSHDASPPEPIQFSIAAPQVYQPAEYAIEPDASAASYFWAAAAITGGDVTVLGLGRDALQGDVAFCGCLEQMGCQVEESAAGLRVRGGALRGIEVDMNAISDTVQTLAAVALFAEGSTTIRGVAHIRHKETDRIGDLARELRKLGGIVDEFQDGLRITPAQLHGADIATYGDHRMAMSLALVGLKVPGVVILDPGCVEKTYPYFFRDLELMASAP